MARNEGGNQIRGIPIKHMRAYIFGTAIDALEQLGSEMPLADRLSCAWAKLGLCNSEKYTQDSTDLRDAFIETERSMIEGNLKSQSEAIQSLIYRIIFEAGYTKAVNDANSN